MITQKIISERFISYCLLSKVQNLQYNTKNVHLHASAPSGRKIYFGDNISLDELEECSWQNVNGHEPYFLVFLKPNEN